MKEMSASYARLSSKMRLQTGIVQGLGLGPGLPPPVHSLTRTPITTTLSSFITPLLPQHGEHPHPEALMCHSSY